MQVQDDVKSSALPFFRQSYARSAFWGPLGVIANVFSSSKADGMLSTTLLAELARDCSIIK
jgi:hypothetical protein